MDPVWRKAPLLLLRWPPILAAIVFSAVILVVGAAVAPLFIASAGSGALLRETRGIAPASAGFTLGQSTPFFRIREANDDGPTPLELLEQRSAALDRALGKLDHLGSPIVTVGMPVSDLFSPSDQIQVQPLARSGFLDHITVLEEVSGKGVWIARSVAKRLGAGPGDVLELDVDRSTEVRVKGVYSDLAAEPVTEYWRPVDRFIHAAQPKLPIPPAPMLGEIETLIDIGARSHSFGIEAWEYGLEPEGMTLEEGRRLSERLLRVSGEALDPDARLGDLFAEPSVHTSLPLLIDSSRELVAGIRSPVEVLAIIGILVALVMLCAAGYYVVEKRSIEFRLLEARGTSDVWIASRAVVESLVPMLVAIAIGGLAIYGLIVAFGPGPVDPAAFGASLSRTVAALVVGVIGFALATALAARRLTTVERSPHATGAGFPWDVLLLVAAGATLYFIRRRGAISQEGEGARLDLLLVLFPIIGVAGAALFALRFLFAYVQRLRGATARSGIALFLAARRLVAASRPAMLFVGATSVAVGMLVYSSALVSSVRASTYAKTHVFVGSDFSVRVSTPEDQPEIDIPTTVVTTLEADFGESTVDVMGIDPETFAATAYWDEAFAERSLMSLIDELDAAGTEPLSVIAAGDFSGDGVTVFGHEVPVEIVGRADVWPGMSQDTPVLVATHDALAAAAERAGFSVAIAEANLWARGPTDAVLAALERAGIDTQTGVSARDAGQSSALLSISWTFGLLRVLGIVAGFLAAIGLLLYVAARQRTRLVSYLLGKRMGLRSGEHRFAVLLELTTLFVLALLLGAGFGLAAAWLVHGGLDLLPTVPPAPLLRIPAPEMLGAVVLLLASAAVGAWAIQRSSDRARPGEVMRLAD